MALAPSGKCRPTLAGTQHVPGPAGGGGGGARSVDTVCLKFGVIPTDSPPLSPSPGGPKLSNCNILAHLQAKEARVFRVFTSRFASSPLKATSSRGAESAFGPLPFGGAEGP